MKSKELNQYQQVINKLLLNMDERTIHYKYMKFFNSYWTNKERRQIAFMSLMNYPAERYWSIVCFEEEQPSYWAKRLKKTTWKEIQQKIGLL